MPRHGTLIQRSILKPDQILRDYRVAYRSRQTSLVARREVLTGKAKFGIFGDGKEVPQVALAGVFRPGDWRSGYYRDQTFMMAAGLLTVEGFFAQLYADPDPEREPASAGRQMTAHFATHLLDDDGSWLRLAELPNVSADVSPTGSQMPRLVGLAQASKLYRALPDLDPDGRFSTGGDEIAFGTIGNASCAEGMFWESINAAGVLRVPMVVSIWDDEYGISVHNEHQVTKGDLSAILSGFARDGDGPGYELRTVAGWDYPSLVDTYREVAETARREHVPAIVHVVELTQPQGHSTSGSQERYKSPERLEQERDLDCVARMRAFVLDEGHADEDALAALEKEETEHVRDARDAAWEAFNESLRTEVTTVMAMVDQLTAGDVTAAVEDAVAPLRRLPNPVRRHLHAAVHGVLRATRESDSEARRRLVAWRREQLEINARRYGSDLYSETERAAARIAAVAPDYESQGDDPAERLNGFEILTRAFDEAFVRCPQLVAFGEDLGRLGDVNQGFSGLQEKHGEIRISDTGIRECTILGQAIGLAMRGLRPLAEIQYLDYILYALQIISDDLATVRYRSAGRQMAPVIVRSRGHRLEGVWHSGSPMAGILNLVRGVYVCVPRDMTRAAGMYNTLLASDDSAIVVEVLNGYRTKEPLPANLGEMRVPLGVPEVLRTGGDVTVVTYGASCKLAADAVELLAGHGIEVELIDVQTLLPFDREGIIGASLRKTHRVVFLDEDVPGGTTAYMMQQVIEEQGGYHWLDGEPRTLSARAHRPAYGSDGDYFSKPNVEQIFETVYELMHEAEPARFPIFYR